MAQNKMAQNNKKQNKEAQAKKEQTKKTQIRKGQPQKSQTFCVYCGAHIDENAKFCGNCGNKIEEAPSLKKSKKGGRLKVAAAVIIICVILAVAAVFAAVQLGIWKTDGRNTAAEADADITEYANGDTAAAVELEHVVADEDTGITYIDNRLIVFTVGELSEEKTAALAEQVDGEVVGDISGMINMLQIQVSVSSLEELEEMAEQLAEEESVAYASYDFPIQMGSEDTDDGTATDDVTSTADDGSVSYSETATDDEEAQEGSWWVEAIGADIAWQYSSLCEKVTIGIIDSGFDLDHPDLTREDGTAVISLLDDFSGNSEANHGTHVAGIIAAQDNEVGMRGIADTADVIAADYTPEEDEVLVSTGEYAIVMKEMIEEEGACVINNSWGQYVYSEKGHAKQVYYEENSDFSVSGYYASMDDQSITLTGRKDAKNNLGDDTEYPFSANDIEHADFYINNELVTLKSFQKKMEKDLEKETDSKGMIYLAVETGDDGETQYVTEVHYLSTDYDFEEEIKSLDYDHYMESVQIASDRTGFFCIILIAQILEYSEDHGNSCDDYIIVQGAGNGYDNGEFNKGGYDTALGGYFCAVNEELFNYLAENYPKLFEGYDIDYQKIKNHIIIVGAVQNSQSSNGEYQLTGFSNYGDNVDICAPGQTIYSTLVDEYGNNSGTSMAAPMVSAAVALVWSLNPDLTAGEVKDILTSTAGDAAGVTGEDKGKTYLMLDVGSAVTQIVETRLGTITGTITDGDTGEILTGVTCTLATDIAISDFVEMETISGADDGSFWISAVGNCTVTLEKDSYDPVELTVTVGLRENVDVGEVIMTPSSNEDVLQAKLDELIETYGLFTSGQRGTASNFVVSNWLDPTGILSATILDLDADGSLELQVCRTTEWTYSGYTYYKVLMEVYEADTQAAYLADSLWFEPYGLNQNDDSYVRMYVAMMGTESDQILATVNAVQMETGYYLVCEYCMQGVLADGGYGATWALEYQDETLQYVCSLENGDVGSLVEAAFAYEFEDGVNTKTTMYYAPGLTDLGDWEGFYTDLEVWDETPGAIKTTFFAKYGLEFAPTEIEFVFYYDCFGDPDNYYGFSGATSGDADTELEFKLVVTTTSGNYESGAYTFEEQLTRGNDLLDSGGADTSNAAEVCDIVLDTAYANDHEFGNIYAYDSNGNLVWSYETGSYPAAELTQVYEIGLRDGCYYFVESGTVVAMDAATGEILWENGDFGGSGSAAFAENCICLVGNYGPDFFAVSYDGTTLCNINSFGTEYYWAYQIDILDNEALVYFDSTYPATVFRVNLDTWEYAISDAG